jgi:hypothetical protein
MGIEPNQKSSYQVKLKQKHKEQLKHMINLYPDDGFNEVASLLREIHKESEESNDNRND